MIATIRKLDCCGKELWRTSTAHGVELAVDFDTQEDARACVLGACQRANAWPLTIDTFLIPGVRTNSELLGALPAAPAPEFQLRNDPPKHTPARFASQDKTRQRVLVEGMDCLPGQIDLF